ncbi:putative protein phosphatase 2C family [Helianthus anomalus]
MPICVVKYCLFMVYYALVWVWIQVLPRASVAGYVNTDIEFQQKGDTFGTTVTFNVIDRWAITAAYVEASKCILDTQPGVEWALKY